MSKPLLKFRFHFSNKIIFTKRLQAWTCLTHRLTPQSRQVRASPTLTAFLHSRVDILWRYSLSPSSLTSSFPAYAICAVGGYKSPWFPLCNITPYLLYCSAHYSLGLTKQHSLSPAAANRPRVTLASASAHLGYTHCINCSTDLVNCLSAADRRKRREESDREGENWNDIEESQCSFNFSLFFCLSNPPSLPLSLSGPTNLPSLSRLRRFPFA